MNELITRSLKKGIATLKAELETDKKELAVLQRQASEKEKRLSDMNKKLWELSQDTHKEIRVTDHALVRYVERVLAVDMDDIRKSIVDDQVRTLTQTLGGTGTFPNSEGLQVVMKNHHVVTVLK